MKRKIGFFIVGLLICYLTFSGFMKTQSYLIGIYTKVSISQADIVDAKRFFTEYLEKYDRLDYYERREMEKLRIEYEIKFLNALEPFVAALEDANQLKENAKES